jgi:hypothetical protein
MGFAIFKSLGREVMMKRGYKYQGIIAILILSAFLCSCFLQKNKRTVRKKKRDNDNNSETALQTAKIMMDDLYIEDIDVEVFRDGPVSIMCVPDPMQDNYSVTWTYDQGRWNISEKGDNGEYLDIVVDGFAARTVPISCTIVSEGISKTAQTSLVVENEELDPSTLAFVSQDQLEPVFSPAYSEINYRFSCNSPTQTEIDSSNGYDIKYEWMLESSSTAIPLDSQAYEGDYDEFYNVKFVEPTEDLDMTIKCRLRLTDTNTTEVFNTEWNQMNFELKQTDMSATIAYNVNFKGSSGFIFYLYLNGQNIATDEPVGWDEGQRRQGSVSVNNQVLGDNIVSFQMTGRSDKATASLSLNGDIPPQGSCKAIDPIRFVFSDNSGECLARETEYQCIPMLVTEFQETTLMDLGLFEDWTQTSYINTSHWKDIGIPASIGFSNNNCVRAFRCKIKCNRAGCSWVEY